MEANKSILLQKQIRDNSEDLQREFLDMEAWEEQMKKKDFEIKNSKDNKVLPPVRTKHKKKSTPYTIDSKDEKPSKTKRIASSDYASWDKFDVEKACEDVEVKSTSKSKKENKVFEIPSEEQLEKEHDEANKFKDEGNALVKRQEWAAAVGKYSQAIKIFPHDAVYYANRALCQLKINNLYSAEADCTAALTLNSNYVKAYHRRALARNEMRRYEDAKKDIEAMIKLDPSNKEAKCMLAQVQERIDNARSKTIDISGSEECNIEKKIGEKIVGKKSPVTKEKSKCHEQTDNKKNKEKANEGHVLESNKTGFKQVIEHEDDQKHAKVEIEEKESTDGLPPWLPTLKEGISIVEPLAEVPQKSKQTLKRILIKEIPSHESIFKDIVEEVSKENPEKTAKQNNDKSVVNSHSKSKTQPAVSNFTDKNKSDVEDNLPPSPKSSVAFILNWRKNSSAEFRYKYLKQIDPKDLPDIFKESMESNIFSEILQILNSKFIQADDKIYDFLNYLSKLKRFRTLVLFMNQTDKEALKNLFKHCKNSEGKTEEDVKSLYATYEI